LLVTIAMLFACFFAMNIGASGTAASMGAAYGGGAIKKRFIAVLLVGIVAFLGAILGGGEVTKTISSGIIPIKVVTVQITILIIASASLVLFISNKLGVPLSTSEVTVGSIIGVGIVFKQIYFWKVVGIVLTWLILPITAYWIAKLLGKGVQWLENNWLYQYTSQSWFNKILVAFLIVLGCYEAFAAGMNNVANAIGPLIASGILTEQNGLWMGALFLALGAILMGGPVLETNGKKITKLSLLQGSVVSFTSGSLVIVASLFGIPVPLTQAATMSIIGVGTTNRTKESIWKNPIVHRIMIVWILSPIIAMISTYSLVKFFIFNSPFSIILFIFTLCFVYSYKTLKVGNIINVQKKEKMR
jgi:sulfate permease